jgi:uncharacterized protein
MSEKMSEVTNALNWFEIPVKNTDAAKKFYEQIFEIQLHPMDMMGMKMSMFPANNSKVGGALVESPMHQPSESGSVIYLNANPDLQLVLDRVEKVGGKIVMPKTLITEENGYMAFFTDTEGNKVGLHSNK